MVDYRIYAAQCDKLEHWKKMYTQEKEEKNKLRDFFYNMLKDGYFKIGDITYILKNKKD